MHILENLPALISQLTSELAESLHVAWAIVVSRFGDDLLPVCSYGQPPDLGRCLCCVSALLSDERAIHGDVELPTRPDQGDFVPAIICPIHIQGETLILAFGPKQNGEEYSTSERDLINGLAAQCGSLSDSFMATTISKKMEQLRRATAELESAREVQHRFFPLQLPPIDGLDYYGECQPAGEVGGDFFDFNAPDTSSLLLSIGDVSGKGVPAAIIMAGLQASLRTLGQSATHRISAHVRDLNRMVWQVSPENFFVTMFYARIDSARSELQYVNAGHEPPILVRHAGDAAVRLESTGTVLGLSTRSAFDQRTVRVAPGDVLVATTDGVTDALYAEGGDAHRRVVLEAVRDHPHASSSDLAGHIIREVQSLSHGMAPEDDQTVVVVKFVGPVPDAHFSRPALSRALPEDALVAC